MQPFWQSKSLAQLSPEEWDQLCDRCGKCCLLKLEDEQTGEVHYTDVACRYLNLDNCFCGVYKERLEKVDACVNLSPQDLKAIDWLPDTCAYKLRYYEQPLPAWHHLVSGSMQTIHQQKMSVAKRVVSEDNVGPDIEERIIHWVD